MARFTFTMAHTLAFWRPRTMVSAQPFRTMHLNDLDEMPRGPGWFDSSWDLEQGLEVCEGLPDDVKLHDWLEATLRDCERAQASAPPAQPGLTLTLCDGMSWTPCDAPALDAGDSWGIAGLALA
jgi:hypothetical protein